MKYNAWVNILSLHHCSHHWFFVLIKAMLCCYFTEMEQGCHPSAFCDPLYVFPGNHQCLFMATISYELCLHWAGMTCVSFQIWNNDDMAYRRTQSCPFNNTGMRGCSFTKQREGWWLLVVF